MYKTYQIWDRNPLLSNDHDEDKTAYGQLRILIDEFNKHGHKIVQVMQLKNESIIVITEIPMRHKFIGSLTDAPSDLSTNPKYMEGFGE